MRSSDCKSPLPMIRNTRLASHTYQRAHHHRAFFSPLRPVRTRVGHYPPRTDRATFDRLSRFTQSKTISFVPPDGRFTLMEYRFDPAASKPGAAPALTAAAAAQLQVQVPFTLRAKLSVTEHGGLSLPPLSIHFNQPDPNNKLTPFQARSKWRSPRVALR